jgi:hypothetical protein
MSIPIVSPLLEKQWFYRVYQHEMLDFESSIFLVNCILRKNNEHYFTNLVLSMGENRMSVLRSGWGSIFTLMWSKLATMQNKAMLYIKFWILQISPLCPFGLALKKTCWKFSDQSNGSILHTDCSHPYMSGLRFKVMVTSTNQPVCLLEDCIEHWNGYSLPFIWLNSVEYEERY